MREYVLNINGSEFRAEVKSLTAESATVSVNGVDYVVELKHLGLKTETSRIVTADPRPSVKTAEVVRPTTRAPQSVGSGTVVSPLPGLVLSVHIKVGDLVKAGQKMMVLETMKMENHIPGPFDGVVKDVFVHNGDTVTEGQALFEIARPDMTTL